MVCGDIAVFYSTEKTLVTVSSDYDYSIMANRCGFPTLVTATFCGRCNDDHGTYKEIKERLLKMTFKERQQYFKNPIHSNRDQLLFIRRNIPFKYPFAYVCRHLELYCPHIYYWFSERVR